MIPLKTIRPAKLYPDEATLTLFVFCKKWDNLVIVKDENGHRREYINISEINAVKSFLRDIRTLCRNYVAYVMNGY